MAMQLTGCRDMGYIHTSVYDLRIGGGRGHECSKIKSDRAVRTLEVCQENLEPF